MVNFHMPSYNYYVVKILKECACMHLLLDGNLTIRKIIIHYIPCTR